MRRFGDYLLVHGLSTEEELDKIEKAAAEKMEAAVEFAINSPEPDPAHVLDDVFMKGKEGFDNG